MAFAWTDLLKFIDIRKVPAQVWLAIALASGAVLFVPSTLADTMGLQALRGAHRVYLGGGLILALAMLLSPLLTYLGREAHVLLLRWRDTQQLRYLAPDQKALLKRYLDEDVGALYLSFNDAVAEGLESMGLLHRCSRFDMESGFGFLIVPWLRLYLKRNPKLLAGSADPAKANTERI
jgi:hypothetical protein